MNSYLQRLAATFVREVGEAELTHYTFVFPNRRAGLFFRKHVAAALEHPIIAPRISTINECFYALSDLKVADQLDLLFRVYQAYKEVENKEVESFDKFLFWGKLMLSDFSEIDNHLIPNVKELFTTIRDLKQIDLQFDYLTDNQKEAIGEFWGDFWKKDARRANENENENDDADENADDNIQKRFLYIWEILYPVYQKLSESLLAEGLAYDGLLHRQLIENWDAIPQERFSSHYVFIGFNALTRSEEELMLRLQEMGIADFYFDYESPWLSDEANRASLFRTHNQQLFRSRYTIEPAEQTAGHIAEITHISTPSTIGETHEVNRILNANANENENADENGKVDYTRTAVVLPDERLLVPMLRVIPEQIAKVNVTMGYPLSITPVFSLIKLLENLRLRMTGAGAYHKDAIAVLSHPYVRCMMSSEKTSEWLNTIRKRNLIYVKIDDPIFADTETATIPYLRSVLSRIEEPNSEELYIVETALNRIDRIIQQYKIEIEERTLFALITMMIGDQTIPYAGEPLEGLQIMGVLETRALDFDNVIITGFNDDLYPGKSQGNSFVPYILRRGFGLPTPERQDAIFAYNFYRMISYAKRVWLITNSRADDQHSGEASRYLAQMRYQYQLPIHEVIVTAQTRTLHSERRTVKKTPAVMAQLEEYATSPKKGFAPSALNAYLRCPLLFYWQNLMNIKESKDVSEELENRELGDIMHAALESLYQPCLNKEMSAEAIEAMKSQVETAVTAAAEKQQIPISTLAHEVICHYVRLILDHDALLVPYRYISSEKHVHSTLTLHDGRVVRIKGVIDRLDQYGAATRLIDYKSGKAELEYKDIASIFDANDKDRNSYALQTILYALMAVDDLKINIDALEPHIYAVRTLSTHATLVHKKTEVDFSLSAIRQEFEEQLRNLIEEILSPNHDFGMTAESRNCENCAFRDLCGL